MAQIRTQSEWVHDNTEKDPGGWVPKSTHKDPERKAVQRPERVGPQQYRYGPREDGSLTVQIRTQRL